MINLNEKITFVDCFDGYYGYEDRVNYVIELGKYFGLTLRKRYLDGDLMVCHWYGSRRDMLAFFGYYIGSMTDCKKGELAKINNILITKKGGCSKTKKCCSPCFFAPSAVCLGD